MSLSPGTSLGQFKVLNSLGAGGMGEVYRARDTKLEREVAIKVLPEAFATDAERMARFKREAKLLAGLNHPNIATLHGLEEIEDTHFLVMELVPGESLAKRLERGALSVEETLEIARQTAEALEAAHEKGVIHRDLKPGNIQITPDDIVKVLDFGLAKAMRDENASDVDTSLSPTMTRDATRAGAILGTVAYMSPEQARGKPIDRRSDVFAFGCVLYEMLTGQKAFDGETVSDILASVIKMEPDWGALPAATPPALRKLLRRCLAKDQKQRLRDFGDVGLELREVLSEPTSPATVDAPAKPKLWAFVLVSLVAFALAWILARRTDTDPPRDVKRFSIPIPTDLELPRSQGRLVGLSPDGRELLLSAERGGEQHLFRRSLDRADWAPVSGTEGGGIPTFSPDGKSFAFRRGGELWVAGIDGGVPTFLASFGSGSPDWAEDGYIYLTSSAPYREVTRVAAAGGEPERLFGVEAEGTRAILRVHKLPHTDVALVTDWSGGLEESNVMLQFLDTGKRRILIEAGNYPRYVPTGHIVFTRENAIHAVAFDLDALQIEGTPRPVIENVRVESGGAAQFEISGEGTLVYLRSTLYAPLQVMLVNRDGRRTLLSQKIGAFSYPHLSPDGRHVALSVRGSEGRHIWVLDRDRDVLTRATFEGSPLSAIWSPDGEELAVSSRPPPTVFVTVPNSGRDHRAVLELDRMPTLGSWLPDGSGLVIASGGDILQLSLDEPGALQNLVATPDFDVSPTLSPNGDSLAYGSDESGDWEIYVVRFPELSPRWQISTEGGTEPRWSHDGSELFYRNGNKMMAVRVSPTSELDPSRPELLFEGAFATTSTNHANYDVTPDGNFIMLAAGETQESPRIEVVLNWFEELKELVPPPP